MKKIIITFLSLVLSLVPLCQAQQAVNHQAMLQQLSPQDLENCSQVVELLLDEHEKDLAQIFERKFFTDFFLNPGFFVPMGTITVTAILKVVIYYFGSDEDMDSEVFESFYEKK